MINWDYSLLVRQKETYLKLRNFRTNSAVGALIHIISITIS